jgi:hypothetical protein
MKKMLTLLFILMMSATLMVSAQEKKNIIKTSLTSIFLKTVNLDYEHAFNTNSSFQLGFYYTSWTPGDASIKGFAITPEYRYYLSSEREAPSGAYIAPWVRYQNFSSKSGTVGTTDYVKGTLSIISAGLVVGVQRTFKDKISLGAYIGPGYYIPNTTIETGEGTFDLGIAGADKSRVWGRAGIDIGFMF